MLLGASVLGSLLNLINPYLTKLVVDNAIARKEVGLFLTLALAAIVIIVLSALVDGVRKSLERFIRLKTGFDLNRAVHKKIQTFSLGWFRERSAGEHLYKINYDVERVRNFITSVPPQAVSVFPQLFFILIILSFLNWKMAVVSLFILPLIYIPTYHFNNKMKRSWRSLIESSQGILKGLAEAFSRIHLIKALGKETGTTRNYLKQLIRNIRIEADNIRLDIMSGLANQLTGKIVIGIVALYGLYQVITGEITLGTFTATTVYLVQLIGLGGQVAVFSQMIAVGLVSCQRLDEILECDDEIPERSDAKDVVFKRPGIVFRDVDFWYKPGRSILKGISFSIESGGNVALVGPSGCGKTTIVNLILRLYDPRNGAVYIDGNDIRDIKLRSLKMQIGVALQAPFLWDDTIAGNIRYGTSGAGKEEVEEAARIAGMDGYINNLGKGYETVIGEDACKLSEGQKQRISIARALIKRPKILILDEAMSSMDSASEEEILMRMKEFRKGMTVITVSHRLSTVLGTDMVYYLKNPAAMKIESAGSLLDNDQDFRALFSNQNMVPPESLIGNGPFENRRGF